MTGESVGTADAAQISQGVCDPHNLSPHHPPHTAQLQPAVDYVGNNSSSDEEEEEEEEEDSCSDASDPLLDTLSDIFSAYRTPRTSFGGNSIASSSAWGHAVAAAAAAGGATGPVSSAGGGGLVAAGGSSLRGSGGPLTHSSEFEGFEEDMRRGPQPAAGSAANLLEPPAAAVPCDGTPSAAASIMGYVDVEAGQGGSHTGSGAGSSSAAGHGTMPLGSGRGRTRPAGLQLIAEEGEEEDMALLSAAADSRRPAAGDLDRSGSGSDGKPVCTNSTSSSGASVTESAGAAAAAAGAGGRGLLASPVSQLLAQPGWERLTVRQLLTQLTAALSQQQPQPQQ